MISFLNAATDGDGASLVVMASGGGPYFAANAAVYCVASTPVGQPGGIPVGISPEWSM
ncbi:MAG: hypothetical protein ABFE13_17750 [Phycisphaerales bacterium]